MQKKEIGNCYMVLLFLILVLPLNLYSQIYNFRNYNIDNGFPVTQPNTFFQDSRGFLWIGTDGEGLVLFDGTSFQKVGANDTLLDKRIRKIVQDKAGTFWIGTESGLGTFDGKKFASIHPSVFSKASIKDLLIDSHGIWIATHGKGLFLFDKNKVRNYTTQDGLPSLNLTSLAKDKGNRLWIGTSDSGIARFDDSKFVQFSTKNGLPDNQITKLIVDRNDSLWVGTRTGLAKFSDNMFSSVNLGDMQPLFVTDLCIDKRNNLWVGTLSGLLKIKDRNITHIDALHGLHSSLIQQIETDSEGNLWVATDLPAVSMLGVHQISHFNQKSGLPSNSVLGIKEDENRKIWMVTTKGLTVFDGKKLHNVDNFQTTASQMFLFEEDTAGVIWIGRNNNITGYDCRNFSPVTRQQLKNRLFLPRTGGIVKLADSKEFVELRSNPYSDTHLSVPSSEVLSIYNDSGGNSWIISKTEGLLVFDKDNKILNVSFSGKLTGKDVTAIVEDKDNSIWLGSRIGVLKMGLDSGNYHIEDVFDATCGIRSHFIKSLVFDLVGNLWIGTANGIYTLNVPEYNLSKKKIIASYGKDEGFINVECYPNASYSDQEGYLWFGTRRGAVRFFPATETAKANRLITYITNVKLFYEDVNWEKFVKEVAPFHNIPVDLKLNHNSNYITFEFVGLHFSNPGKVRYQYRLLPEGEWSDISFKTEATFSNLAPGKYNFQVRASVNEIIWSIPAAFAFSISKPFWKTWWFYALVGLSVFGIVYGYITSNTRSLRIIQKDLEVKVQQRTWQLEDQKNKLQEAYKIIEEKNSEITDSIRYAKNIQEAILPPLHLLKNFLPDSFVFFMPKDIVSGDFYWLGQTETKVVVAAVDCTGHGVPGAFMSFVGYNLLNQIVNQAKITSPAEILNNLNISLNESLRNTLGSSDIRDGMDIAVCTIDVELKIAEYAGAYNPLYHIRNKNLRIYPADRFPVGSYMEMSHKKFTNHIIELLPGDTIYIFTDGYSDQFGGPDDKKFMYAKFRNLLLNVQDLNLTEQKLVLYKEFHNWKGVNEQVDDVLVIGIRI